MFAVFGFGMQEILVLAILGMVGMVVVVVLFAALRPGVGRSDPRIAELEAENRSLRERLNREE